MDPNGRVSLKEFKNFLSFVCTQVIGNHVDLATCWLTNHDLCKEVDELGTGVPCAGFSQHLAGLSVQSAVERKRSMAVVLEAMSFGPAGGTRQNRVQAIQGLDGALLVNAEYSRVHRRLLGQSDGNRGHSFLPPLPPAPGAARQ